MTLRQATDVALSFEGAEQSPHFEKTSFRIRKKIFLTLDSKHQRGCVKLSPVDQDVFAAMLPGIIYPVPNAWGRQGWTFLDLPNLTLAVFRDVVRTSFEEVRKSGRSTGK